jgi:hypothetical protein
VPGPRPRTTRIDTTLTWLAKPGVLPEPQLSAIGISDRKPANILWDGQTCRLVDFEDSGLSDPAYELADHVEHIARRLAGIFDPQALVDAVGLSAEERERLRAYRPLWAAFWLAMLLPGNGGFRRNPSGTTEAQAAHLLALLTDRAPRSETSMGASRLCSSRVGRCRSRAYIRLCARTVDRDELEQSVLVLVGSGGAHFPIPHHFPEVAAQLPQSGTQAPSVGVLDAQALHQCGDGGGSRRAALPPRLGDRPEKAWLADQRGESDLVWVTEKIWIVGASAFDLGSVSAAREHDAGRFTAEFHRRRVEVNSAGSKIASELSFCPDQVAKFADLTLTRP